MSNFLELTAAIYKKGLKWHLHKDNQIDTFAFSLYYFGAESVSVGQKVLTEMQYANKTISLPMTRNDIKIQNQNHAFYVIGQGRTSYYSNGPYDFCKGFAGVIMAKTTFSIEISSPVNDVSVALTFKGQTKEYSPADYDAYLKMTDGHNSTDIVSLIDASGASFSAEWTNSSSYTDFNDERNSINLNPFVKDVVPANGDDASAANLPPSNYIITKWTGSNHTGTWWSSTRYSLTWKADNWLDTSNTNGSTPNRVSMWPAQFYSTATGYSGTSKNDQRIKYLRNGRIKYMKKVIKIDDYHYNVELEVPIKYIYSAASEEDWAEIIYVPIPIVIEHWDRFDGKMFYDVINSIQVDINGYKYVDTTADYSYSLVNENLTAEVVNNSILKLPKNEFIKYDTTINGVAWDKYWPLKVLSKYKQGKYYVECEVPAEWAIENNIVCDSQVMVKLPDNSYIGQVVSFSTNYSIEYSGKSMYNKVLNRDYVFYKYINDAAASFIIEGKNINANLWWLNVQTALLTLKTNYQALTKIIYVAESDTELQQEYSLDKGAFLLFTQSEEGQDELIATLDLNTLSAASDYLSFTMNPLVELDATYRSAIDKVCPSGTFVQENRSNVVRALSIFSIKNITKKFSESEFVYTLKMIETDQIIPGVNKIYTTISSLQTNIEYFFGEISATSNISRFDMRSNNIHIRLRYNDSLSIWRDYYVGRVVINKNEKTLSTYRWIVGSTYTTYERFDIETLGQQEFIVTIELLQPYTSAYNLNSMLASLDGYISSDE